MENEKEVLKELIQYKLILISCVSSADEKQYARQAIAELMEGK